MSVDQRRKVLSLSMNISLGVGVAMLIAKWIA